MDRRIRAGLTAGVLAAVIVLATRIDRTRLQTARAALLGRTVVYRARFEDGTLVLDGHGAVVAESTFTYGPQQDTVTDEQAWQHYLHLPWGAGGDSAP